MTEPPPALRYLALGDSYTIGEKVDPGVRWPVLLADALRARGVALAPPAIIAETGWTTDELDEAITRADLAGPFDFVSLLIGVNDQYRERSVEAYRAGFLDLLGRAIGFAGGDPGRMLVLSIPDWGVTPFAEDDTRSPGQIAAEIEAYNAAARAEATREGAHFVDITPVSRTAAGDPSLTAEDGLHPSGAMYALWTDLALPVALRALTAS